MFSGRHTLPLIDGRVFVDRDPSAFLKVVNYLRNNQQMPKQLGDEYEQEMVELEMRFWGVSQ